MKTNSIRSNDSGAVMVTTALCIFGICTLLVVGYLWLLMGHERRVQESQSWNQAMAVAEAGVEESMAQLNWGTVPGKGDLSANGWGVNNTPTAGVDAYGPPGQRALTGGSYYASILAPPSPILTNGASATIYSTGMVSAPISGTTISRRVEVMATMQPLFRDAVDVVSNFNSNGNSVVADSYNSESTNLSTGGQYDPSKTSTNGNVGAEFGTVDLGHQDTITGNLYLGPNANFVSGSNQVDGTVYNNYNIQIQDAQLPVGNWQDAVATNAYAITTNVVGGYSSYSTNSLGVIYNFTQSGDYRITVAGGSHPIQIAPGVTVNLDVQLSSFDTATTNGCPITLLGGLTNTATANLYQESGSVNLGDANGGTSTYRPDNLVYYGLPGVTSLTFSGNSTYVGVIYAPEASLTLNGGGNGAGVAGAIVVQSITEHGHFDMHFDEALAIYGPSEGFVATSWREF